MRAAGESQSDEVVFEEMFSASEHFAVVVSELSFWAKGFTSLRARGFFAYSSPLKVVENTVV